MRIKLKFFLISCFLITASGQASDHAKKTSEAKITEFSPSETGNKAIHVMDEWMRDPFITLGPDGYYYLTCTRLWHSSNEPGLEIWRSKDLRNWEEKGLLWSFGDSRWMQDSLAKAASEMKKDPHLWAPEIYFIDGRWVAVFTSSLRFSNLIATGGTEPEGPFREPFGAAFAHKHDPSVFTDDDGSKWLVWGCTKIAPLKDDLSGFSGPERSVAPSNRKMGHEGCFILKIDGKYVLFGTAWSTDIMRHGSYNLYYCTADHIEGPYGPRKFAGRFLGHGTIFQDKQGNWWCTAFLNGDYVTPEQVIQHGISTQKAETINRQGLTLVPMKIDTENGDIVVRPKDPDYAIPGDDEAQDFSNSLN
ncbi:family 43 glycosylhydrolase [Gaoshiqia sp. Z1-71]|uniref:family 43 glycosylhydrolase n=1 Tax=Gaoshiqia hydrogeniformans TaxID=3290090 RepID=UPI003BF7A185